MTWLALWTQLWAVALGLIEQTAADDRPSALWREPDQRRIG